MQLRAISDGFSLRLSVFFFATFLVVGCYMPYMPLWLKEKGLSDFQISLVFAAPIFIRVAFTPMLTFLADRSGRPVRFLIWLSWGAVASVSLLSISNGFYEIFLIILLFTLFWKSVIPVTDAVALAGARTGRMSYGRMRLWGSISFIVMTGAGGAVVDLWGAPAALWLFIGASVCVLIAAYWLPGDDTVSSLGAQGAVVKQPVLRLNDMVELVRQWNWWIFLAAASAIQSAHALYYIFGTLHWTSLGKSPAIIGILWGTGVIAEVILFAYGLQVSRRISAVQLIAIAGIASVLRWTVTAFDPVLPVLFLAQLLHGLTFGAAHLGAMHYIQQAVPASLSASAQGLYASVTMGIVMGVVSLTVGPLYRTFAGTAYLAMAVLGAVGLIAALSLMKRWDGETIAATGGAS